MTTVLVLLSVAATFAKLAPLSDLSKELLTESLIWIDENNVPNTLCMVSRRNESSTIDSCTMSEGFGPRGVGCFSIWSSTGILQQGCYSGQEISLRAQCRRRRCVANEDNDDVSFCCCHGPLCNASYSQKK